VDACDPVRGVIHQPAAVDDSDACTVDACDPRTGDVTHRPVDTDDGDDCTFDSCDPQTGVAHQRPSPIYTCEASCGTGFHAASRATRGECLQSYCVPDCGPSFHSCDGACPPRYRKVSEVPSRQCGPVSPVLTFCVKE
jgi:hypothetical protein